MRYNNTAGYIQPGSSPARYLFLFLKMSRAAARWATKEPKKQPKIKIKKHLQDSDLSSGAI
jgi:hypothetical protein